ncbi:MAG TPA: pilus assembly protein [Anaerolineales bacterium]|nr:pilus assembly protein [Anaerolineales bacterium]
MKPHLLLDGERAQGLYEYALIILFVAIVLIVALNILGTGIVEGIYQNVINQI